MDIRQTLFLYLLLGGGVAMGWAARSSGRAKPWLTILAAWVFWPLFVPLLLDGGAVEEAALPVPRTNRDELTARIQKSGELLDRLVTAIPPTGIADLPEKLGQTKSRWGGQLAWLIEADTLTAGPKASPEEQARIEELRRMQSTTVESLDRSLDSLQELAIMVQILKAPGADRPAELARLERVLNAIIELETTPAV